MALAQIYSAISGDIITAARWNNEFGNIYSNGTDVAFPLTKAVSLAGFTITWDVAGISTITSPSNTGFLFTIGAKSGTPSASGSLSSFTASTFTDTSTGASGIAPLWSGLSVRTPTLAASAALVTTTVAASLYVESNPAAGANETITQGYGFYTGGNIGYEKPTIGIKGSNITAAAAIAVTVPFADVTGATTISSISTVYPAGAIFKLRFTGTGLNITYNATSMITPWAVDYRTVPNEILEFLSLGSGNYQVYSLNGPKERTGVTIEGNTASAPAGYLLEDGSSLLRATYTGLFAEIGTAYGNVDGTHFNVPDQRGRVSIMVDGAANIVTANSLNGANADTLGGLGGLEVHTLLTAEMPGHTHQQQAFTTGGAGPGPAANAGAATPGSAGLPSTQSTGGNGAHSNTQPWIAKMKFIRF